MRKECLNVKFIRFTLTGSTRESHRVYGLSRTNSISRKEAPAYSCQKVTGVAEQQNSKTQNRVSSTVEVSQHTEEHPSRTRTLSAVGEKSWSTSATYSRKNNHRQEASCQIGRSAAAEAASPPPPPRSETIKQKRCLRGTTCFSAETTHKAIREMPAIRHCFSLFVRLLLFFFLLCFGKLFFRCLLFTEARICLRMMGK